MVVETLTRTNRSFVGMNYLGHAYLSFGHPEILTGNMISDFVKGKAKFGFSGNIIKGIDLHRQIDSYTDNHAAIKSAKEIFRPAYRLYSGAIVDVVLDHFLAADRKEFPENTLFNFTTTVYQQLEHHRDEFPPVFTQIFAYMKTQNWLYGYREKEAIRNSLAGLVRRATYLSESTTAYNLFLEHYVHLEACYRIFFEDVKQFAKHRFQTLVEH